MAMLAIDKGKSLNLYKTEKLMCLWKKKKTLVETEFAHKIN